MKTESNQTPLTTFNGNDSYLISFEGIEGSGKTTQIQAVKEHLEAKGYSVSLLREPGGTKFGENLRSAILESQSPIHPLAEALLFASSRTQLLSENIIPFLAKPKSVVLLDRYIDSSIAYQGFARGLGMDTVVNIHSQSPLNTLPNLTLYLKIDLETSMARQAARGNEKDYFEKENNKFYQSLIDGYNACADNYPDRVKTIDAKDDIESVKAQILSTVEGLIK